MKNKKNRWENLLKIFPDIQKFIRKKDEIIITRSLKKDKIFGEILDYFNKNFKDKDFKKISEVLYRIENNLKEKPKCLNCNKKLEFENTHRGYGKYCSRTCSSTHSELIKKRKKTCQEKYGGNSPFSSKEIQDKIKETWQEKYGVDNPIKNNDIKEKAVETIKKKYGVDNVFKLDSMQQYAKEKMKEKYGVAIPLQNQMIKEKVFNTNLKRYGVKIPAQTLEIQKKISNTCQKKYGVKWFTQTEEFSKIVSIKNRERYDYLKNLNNLNKEFIKSNFFNEKGHFLRENFCKYFGYKPIRAYQLLKHFDIKYEKQGGSSLYEEELKKFIKFIYSGTIIENSRKIINPYELDIYIPEKNIAIEFDGLLWHSEGSKNFKNDLKYYHLKKTKLAEEKNINLLHIFENEWLDPIKQDIWKSIISYKLGIVKQRYYARKLKIKEISNKEATRFFEENHIQGSASAGIKLALIDNSEIISCITFGKSRFNKNYQYELIRFASKKYSSCVGCAQRLFKYFLRTYQPKSIISYANRRWAFAKSNVYQKIGFEFLRETEPNYYYFKLDFNPKLFSRNKFQKHKLKKYKDTKDQFNPSLTESEIMFSSGYRRIYDCGQLVYEY